MTEKEKYAYTAGLIDGEGYISLLPVWKGHGYCAVVKVSSVDPFMTTFLYENYGGNLGRLRIHKPPQRPSRQWTLRNGRRVHEFLTNIYPYLQVKKAQADVVMEYVESFSQNSLRNETVWAQKRVFYDKIRKLNRRGMAPAETE